jgi:hypothetical protein
MRLLLYFSTQQQIKASIKLTGTVVYICIISSKLFPSLLQAMPAIPNQGAPGEIFFNPTKR